MKWLPFSLLLTLIFFLLPVKLFPQEAVIDSSAIKTHAISDSLQADSLRAFLPAPQSPKTTLQKEDIGIEVPVEYSARMIDSHKSDGNIFLTGDAKVKYKDVTIEAGKITIKWNDNLLVAEGIPDTSNHTEKKADSLKTHYKDFPKFSDGKEVMVGESMEYNFKSEKGRIVRGRTQFQKGYYSGDAVKRIDPEVFFVKNGVYSTCENDAPHFHFRGKKMKVILNDKVIAKPITFYLGKIPLAIFPFAMFSTEETGRQSGVILPQYGSSPTEGRYLRNMGYYWATNDNIDMRLTMDFFERTGVLFRGNMNYAQRYKFTGSINGSITRKDFETFSERRWNLNINHSQTIDETSNLAVTGSFQSNNSFYKEYSSNINERLNRQIRSNATYSKRWGEGKNSVTVNLSQTKDIESGNENLTLPQIRFTRSRSAIFPFKKDKTGRSKKEQRWYNYLQYDYKSLLTNKIDRDTISTSPDNIDRRIEHDASFSFTNPNKLFGMLSLNQSFRYDEDWFDRRQENFALVDSTNGFESEEKESFFARRTFSYTASASSNLYGTVFPNVFSITALRHKMTPSVSFSYRPDFSDERWGYYETRVDTNGREQKFDRYGGTPRGKQMSMGIGLTNLFQMKLGKDEKEKKVDLFNVDLRTNYNFAADSLKLGNLSTGFRANPRRNFNVTARLTHSFYDFNTDIKRTLDNFISPRLTNFRVDARWSLSGKKKTPDKDKTNGGEEPVQVNQISAIGPGASGNYQDRFAPEKAFSALDIAWKANLSFSYNINKSNPSNLFKSAYIDLSNVEMQLTQHWRLGYKLRYDLEKTEILDQRISFYRDLHCWEARFDWSPSGISQGFYFIVNIKASHLRQVKVERRGGTTSVFNPF